MTPLETTAADRRKQSLLERLDCECPPFWAYAYARKYRNGPWIGVVELCKRSGLPRRSVIRIGSKISWRGVKVEVISSFLKGCGFQLCGWNIVGLQKARKYIRWQQAHSHRPYGHLSNAQWNHYNKLCQLWVQSHE
jgi:hypothetical protein